MKLVKGDRVYVTDDIDFIAGFKNSGWVEATMSVKAEVHTEPEKEKVEKKPKTATKKK